VCVKWPGIPEGHQNISKLEFTSCCDISILNPVT